MLGIYAGLAASAFLAATIVPFSSEAALLALLAAGQGQPVLLVAAASVGNIAGSAVNWLLGRFIQRFRDRSWFPVGPGAYARAEAWFNRFGLWSLLFAWVPVVGDPLTLVAGALRVGFIRFLLLVGIGKVARYAVLAGGLAWWQGSP